MSTTGPAVTVSRTGTVVRLHPDGDLDLATSPALAPVITTALAGDPAPEHLVVDLHRVGFIDCAAVTVLLVGRDQAAARGVTYRVVGAGRQPAWVLRLLDLDTILLDHPSRP